MLVDHVFTISRYVPYYTVWWSDLLQ